MDLGFGRIGGNFYPPSSESHPLLEALLVLCLVFGLMREALVMIFDYKEEFAKEDRCASPLSISTAPVIFAGCQDYLASLERSLAEKPLFDVSARIAIGADCWEMKE